MKREPVLLEEKNKSLPSTLVHSFMCIKTHVIPIAWLLVFAEIGLHAYQLYTVWYLGKKHSVSMITWMDRKSGSSW